jgi:hypothetical protein
LETCWNFFGASKLAKNTQNRLAVPKSRRKTLKTEQKQSLEARRSLTGVSLELARTCRRRQNRPATSKTATTDSNVEHKSTFQQPKHQSAGFFFFFFLDGCCNFASHHRQDRKPPQNTPVSITDHQKQKKKFPFFFFFFFFVFCFFPLEGVPVSIKQEQNTTIEIYKGTACVGYAVTNKRKTQR